MPRLLLCFLLLAISNALAGQQILLLERSGSPRPKKIFAGESIDYRLRGEQYWLTGQIESLREDQQLIVLDDRYLDLRNIESLRFYRPYARPLGIGLITFGVGWSAFGLIGYNTDNDPTTKYQLGDAITSATAIGLGFLLPRLLGTKKVRLGDSRRLRIVDVTF